MIAHMERSKKRLRESFRSRLHGLGAESRAVAARRVCDKLAKLEPIREARSVLVFLALPHEVDLRPLIQSLLGARVEVSLPRVNWQTSELTPARIEGVDGGVDGLVSQRHGVMEPPAEAPAVPVERLDVVLTPGLAFDLRGARLGHGAGMYDRLLARPGLRAWVCGCGFEQQVVERLPMGPTDKQMDAVATDKRLLLFPGRHLQE